MNGRRLLLSSLVLVCCALRAAAAEVTIVQSLPLSGTQASTGGSIHAGARLYIDWVNARGGVSGNVIRLLAYDDEQKVEQTLANIHTLLARTQPVALLGVVGTANNEALIKDGILQASGLPLVGPTSGATSMTNVREVFPIKAGYREEVRKLLDVLNTIGATRVGIVWQDDGLGRDVLTAAESELARQGRKPAVVATYARNTVAVEGAVKAMAAHELDVILLGGVTAPVAEFARQYRAARGRALLAGLSIVDPNAIVKALGAEGARAYMTGVVFPNPQQTGHPIIMEMLAAKKALNRELALNPRMVEGYVAAKVTVEAIRRAGAAPTRAGVMNALRAMRNFDAGGDFVISFTDASVPGSRYVDVGILGAKGVLMQ
jgi:ABC-type branched-subunit amino acid transport system substrate-binding protein